MITPLTLLITALAVARVTRLITTDLIFATPRGWLLQRIDGERLGYLLVCDWCMSVWVALAAAPLMYWHGDSAWFQVPALALALSQVTGFLAQRDGDA